MSKPICGEKTVYQSLEQIENRISDKLTVENIADGVYFSKNHYQRLFREVAGESVMEYVTKRRLTLAGKALVETEAAIIDIAFEYGYNSREGFTRSFKAYMGVSPTEYRKYGLTAISQKEVKERNIMTYSKAADEIMRELNDFIAKTRSASEAARKIKSPRYSLFWNSVADDADLMAERAETALTKISAISERPYEINNRFLILKTIEDIAFETNVMALQVSLTAIGRANPEDIQVNKPVCDKYYELAKAAGIKAGKIAGFLNELFSLIIEDMRNEIKHKVDVAVQCGREASESSKKHVLYIKNELDFLVSELSSVPIETVSESMLEDLLMKLKIIILSAKVDALRQPELNKALNSMNCFADALGEAADFCRSLPLCEDVPLQKASMDKCFQDIAYQSCILRFYTNGEIEKCGLLDGEQRAAFAKIDKKLDECIHFTLNATDVSAYSEISERISEVASGINGEAEKLGDKGGAFRMLAEEYSRLSEVVKTL